MRYQAEVTREGRWWMVSIPEIDGLTQTRRLSEAGQMAREYVAAALGIPVESVEVDVTVRRVEGLDVAERVAKIEADRAEASRLEREASRLAVALAKDLSAAHVPLRDVGVVLGVSHQRAHQLVASK